MNLLEVEYDCTKFILKSWLYKYNACINNKTVLLIVFLTEKDKILTYLLPK